MSLGSDTRVVHNQEDNLTRTPFDEFWDLYPRKAGRENAARAWEKARP